MIIGRMICRFYNREIDRLIDHSEKSVNKESVPSTTEIVIPLPQLPGKVIIYTDITSRKSHDAGRVTCDVLLSQVKEVLSRFGEPGLCYYVLHHYLDKLWNMIRGQLLHLYSQTKDRGDFDVAFDAAIRELVSHFKEVIREGFETEVSVFKALELIVDKGFKDLSNYLELEKYEMELFSRYKSRTRRDKEVALEALWYMCLETLKSQQDWELAKYIVETAKHVKEKIIENAERVWCILMRHQYQKFLKELEAKTLWFIMKSLNCIEY